VIQLVKHANNVVNKQTLFSVRFSFSTFLTPFLVSSFLPFGHPEFEYMFVSF